MLLLGVLAACSASDTDNGSSPGADGSVVLLDAAGSADVGPDSTKDTGEPGGDSDTPEIGVDSKPIVEVPVPVVVMGDGVDVDFGEAAVGQLKTAAFTLVNDSEDTLRLQSLAPTPNGTLSPAFDDVSIESTVLKGSGIAPNGGSRTFKLAFLPTALHLDVGGALGTFTLETDDATRPAILISVFAKVRQAELIVSPTALEFGTVQPGVTRSREVTFKNEGEVTGFVSQLSIEAGVNAESEEFAIVQLPGTEFDPVAGLVILGGEEVTVTIAFTNEKPAVNEPVHAALTYESNGLGEPVPVDLTVQRIEKTECIMEIAPTVLTFGPVLSGGYQTATFDLTNVGNAPCSWSHAVVGAATPTVVDGVTQHTCHLLPSVFVLSQSTMFEVVGAPAAVMDGIEPGETVPLDVQFGTPPSLGPGGPSELLEFSGLLQVTVLDHAQVDDDGKPKSLRFPAPLDSEGDVPTQAECNLGASVRPRKLAAVPQQVSFPNTTVDCSSPEISIDLTNTTSNSATVCDIHLEGCGPDIELSGVPQIPDCSGGIGGLKLESGTNLTLGVSFSPTVAAPLSCTLVVDELDFEKTVEVSLNGVGSEDSEQVDTFSQIGGQRTDVLFVVDNSASMLAKLDVLVAGLQDVVAGAGDSLYDYHVGVLPTDIHQSNADAGKLKGAEGARFFTSSNGDIALLETAVNVGGSGEDSERGLEAARRALSTKLTGQIWPETVCATDSACGDTGSACTTSMIAPATSFCGHANMEFLRSDASLEIIFVSDENDVSAFSVSTYIDFFKALKGPKNTELLHAHAIVGDEGNCSGGGNGLDGARFREVADATGGLFQSICGLDWSQTLTAIFNQPFPHQTQFFLSRPAAPSSIVVTIGAMACDTGWSYELATNSVVLDADGDCFPKAGAAFDVSYEVLCLP